ncbi:MAG: hypothetical protein ACK5LX_06465 [Oscillospiraceae bacterium]
MTQSSTWFNLDTAANIYPAISNDRNTNVYRLSCELRETIRPEVLKQALDKAMEAYSYFRVVMRRGLFWFYLEPTDQEPDVVLESQRPCARIFYKQIKSLLFQVSYFGGRINLEMFHALADGGGAIDFMRTIVYEYLVLVHREELPSPLPVLDISPSSPPYQAEDSFLRYYTEEGGKQGPFFKKALLLGGTTLPSNSVQVISAKTSVRAVLTLAKGKKATLTAYLTALLICAVYTEMTPRRFASRDIGVTIPVDLRGHFASSSSRNFFGVVNVRYNFMGGAVDFDRVLESVTGQLNSKVGVENLARSINYNISLQKNIFARFVPLFLKNFVLKRGYRRSESTATTVLSNMGRILMPEEFAPYIDNFSCLLNPSPIQKVKLCVSSYRDALMLNFTSCIAETGIQKYVLRHLAAEGAPVCITTNTGTNMDSFAPVPEDQTELGL